MRALVAVALACAGCFYIDASFTCEGSAGSCGPGGVCEPCGFCSFADNRCTTSGRKYGPLAPAAFAGKCVESAPICDGQDLSGAADAGSDFSAKEDGGDLAVQMPGDLAGADLAMVDGLFVSVDGGGPCGFPQLLVAVENLGAGPPFQPGMVLRYHVPQTGPIQKCATLNGRGSLSQRVEAVGFIAPDRVVTAGRDYVNFIDPATDSITWFLTVDPTLFAVDVAPIDAQNGKEAAVFYSQIGFGPKLESIHLYKEKDPAWRTKTKVELSLQNALSLTIDPWNPARLLVLVDYGTAEFVDPYSGEHAPYLDPGDSIGFHSVHAIPFTGGGYVAYAADGTYQGYYTSKSDQPPDAGTPGIAGVATCAGCYVLHVVPDPYDTQKAYILCDAGTVNGRMVQHVFYRPFPSPTICTPVVDGTSLGAEVRITRLAMIAP